MKKCCRCKQLKNKDQFSKDAQISDGFKCACKACLNITNKKYYTSAKIYRDANPIRQTAKNLVRFWPGSTWQQAWNNYTELLLKQNSVCAICKGFEVVVEPRNGKTKNLAVDHCHKTQKVRGLLCDRCNRGIGFLQDKQEVCLNAFNYLKSTKFD